MVTVQESRSEGAHDTVNVRDNADCGGSCGRRLPGHRAAARLRSRLRRGRAPADVIISNGKIITVDERFTIAQAVAVRGDRIVAVGSDAEIAKWAGPATRRIDLRGRAVIPGLIDNHMHLLRAGTTWQWEVRWDGVGTRAAALEKLRARAKAVAPGEWVYNLGGWAIEQFADDSKPFTREELDKVAPDNPVFLQASYYEAYLNSRALQQLKIDEKSPDWAVRDAKGQPTGRITEAGFRGLVGRLPTASPADVEKSTLGMIRDLNRAGLTTFGVAGCDADLIGTYRKWAAEGKLNVRTFCIDGVGVGNSPSRSSVRCHASRRSSCSRATTGSTRSSTARAYTDRCTIRCSFVSRIRSRNSSRSGARSRPRSPRTVCLYTCTPTSPTRSTAFSIRLRRSTRMPGQEPPLGAGAREPAQRDTSRAHEGAGTLRRRSPMGRHQRRHQSARLRRRGARHGGARHHSEERCRVGIRQRRQPRESDPALHHAVVGCHRQDGRRRQVLRQPISREDALIAHTRRNAFLVFQENNLGSIQAGRLADLVVMDRDYLTIPADQIKDIKSMTMVGGRIVYDAASSEASTQ